MTDTTTNRQGHKGRGSLSVDDDTLDQMVQQASVPSLASLFKQAKDQGLIGPVTTYGGSQGGA
jgi:hypothetical protein